MAVKKKVMTKAKAKQKPAKKVAKKRSKKKALAASALSVQEGGNHYKLLGEYQPWEVAKHWLTDDELRGFCKGTVIAYLARERQKGGRLDIKKAMHTIQLYLELTLDED